MSTEHGVARAASIAVQPNSSSSSRKARGSHALEAQAQTLMQAQGYPQQDVYSHPAAVAYAAAHPRRQIPRFGPYLLLQTLGEGEFGKVKLGLHIQWGEEVAVKLIRRGNIDNVVRMSKVEREIEVLRTLKHPNIVRLYDVIETDKYIGIIIEYASGGELFDHILAHRYLKEKDAAKLFSQLLSGVWYIHQKKIVHRDLKLENLLLDRHRNVIITDFGFANRFEHRSDDLMQTSCGSPCYAAPELVISEGLYVGSAVDIWSCGVILYAMLAGYLPFDDDPLNPDGDNINLLYKYIVNTPLSFPDYISSEARDLLSMMLVPDPANRATLDSVMAHSWLSQYAYIFERSVDDLEQLAMEQHQTKRLAYQKQMKQAAAAAAAQTKVSRSQTVKSVDPYAGKSRAHQYPTTTQPHYLYETDPSAQRKAGGPTTMLVPAEVHTATIEDESYMPSVPQNVSPTDEFAMEVELRGEPKARRSKDEGGHRARKTSAPTAEPKKKGGFRHTIQVEYEDSQQQAVHQQQQPQQQQPSAPSQPRRVLSKKRESEDDRAASNTTPATSLTRERSKTSRRPSQSSTKPLPVLPPAAPAQSDAEQGAQAASPIPSPVVPTPVDTAQGSLGSLDSQQSKRGKHRKGLSMDRIGLGKIFGSSLGNEQPNGAVAPEKSAAESSVTDSPQEKRPITLQTLTGIVTPKASSKNSLLTPGGDTQKNSRRNTLTVMVEPFRSRKGKSKPTVTKTDSKEQMAEVPPTQQPQPQEKPITPSTSPPFTNASNSDFSFGSGISASTNKARKVMQFFRSKSKGRDLSDLDSTVLPLPSEESQAHDATPTQDQFPRGVGIPADADGPVAPAMVYITPSEGTRPGQIQRAVSSNTDTPISLASRVKRSVGLPSKGVMRIHHGAVDSKTTTSKPPAEVMKQVRGVLVEMGMEVSHESDFKFRCVRVKRKKNGSGVLPSANNSSGSGGLTAFAMVGSAASNGIDKRGLPVPSSSSFGGGIIKGLLMRRQSSQISANSALEDDPSTSPVSASSGAPPEPTREPVYGNVTIDAGDEVRFSVELTRLDRLDLYSLDIRRLKGNLRSYKFLYDMLRERVHLGE